MSQSVNQPAFFPATGYRNGHLQTLAGAFLRPVPTLTRRRIRLQLPDQDFIDVDWCDWPRDQGIIIFHGMGGSSASRYVLELQQQCNVLRLSTVAVNLRGASGEPNRVVQAYHAGAGSEIGIILGQLLDELKLQAPQVKIWHLVGFSLSGSMLIHWWSLQQAMSPLSVGLCVTVCTPLHLPSSANAMNHGLGLAYQAYLLGNLKRQFKTKLLYFERSGRKEQATTLRRYMGCLQARSFWEFDAQYVAPAHGFKDVQDYYERASALPCLRHGQWPLLMIYADDDPLVPPIELQASSVVTPWRYSCGGHVGFMGQDKHFGLKSALGNLVLCALRLS